jgi:hypothetical protein
LGLSLFYLTGLALRLYDADVDNALHELACSRTFSAVCDDEEVVPDQIGRLLVRRDEGGGAAALYMLRVIIHPYCITVCVFDAKVTCFRYSFSLCKGEGRKGRERERVTGFDVEVERVHT